MKNLSLFKVNISEMVMAAMFLAIGIIAKSYIKIGNTEFVTIPIYIALAITLPLSLSLITSILIDTLSMLFKGTIGTWWWTFTMEPVFVILISFLIFNLFKNIKEPKLNFSFLIGIIVILFSIGVFYFSKNGYKLFVTSNLEKKVTNYISVIAFGIIIIFFTTISFLQLFEKIKPSNSMLILIIISSSIIVDILWFPFSLNNWLEHFNGHTLSTDALRWTGFIRSFIHIFFSYPLAKGIYEVLIHLNKRINKY